MTALLLAGLLLAAVAPPASAGGISVARAELRRADDKIQPVADFTVTPTSVVEQALMHGVPLYFISEFSLIRERWYWLNEVIARDEQTVKLSYNALTRQYRLSHGALFQNFNSLSDALQTLEHQAFSGFRTLALRPGAGYVASVRMHLDLSQLPKPLQINALVNNDWSLDSDWYRWDVGMPSATSGTRVNEDSR